MGRWRAHVKVIEIIDDLVHCSHDFFNLRQTYVERKKKSKKRVSR